jgi:hypothetical protein
MNTFQETFSGPWVVAFKTDLASAQSEIASLFSEKVAIAKLLSAFAQLTPARSNALAFVLETRVGDAMRAKGILAKMPACAENDFASDVEIPPFAIWHRGQGMGFFEVTDWRAGLDILRSQLGEWNFDRFSEVGWHDPDELILRIEHPAPRQELMQVWVKMARRWTDEMKAEELKNPPQPAL